MTVIGKASIDIRANDKFFERDVKKMARGIKDIRVDVKADVQIAGVTKKLSEWRKRQQDRTLMLKADISTERAQKRLDSLWNKYDKKTLSTNLDVSTSEATSELSDFWNAFDGQTLNVAFEADQTSLAQAQRTVEDMSTSISGMRTTVTANADTALAEAKLAMLARNRTANINLNLSPDARAALSGAFNAITGTLPAKEIKNIIYSTAADFEGLVTKAAAFSTLITGAGAGLTYLGGSLANILVDITKIVGLTAALPALVTSAFAVSSANTMAWGGFGDALDEDALKAAKATAKLVPAARGSAIAFRGMQVAVREATKTSYWDALGDKMEDVVKRIRGPIISGYRELGSVMGSQMAEVFEQVGRFGDSGALESTFNNINEAVRRATSGVAGFASGYLSFLEGGSKLMPSFGSWIADIGTGFAAWADEANKSGDIRTWVMEGVDAAQQLGSVLVSTGGIIGGVGKAARDAGLPGLKEFADGLRDISEIVNSDSMQSSMVSLFDDSADAMSNMGPGFRILMTSLREGMPALGEGFEIAGTTVSGLMANLSALARSGGGQAVLDLMSGFGELVFETLTGSRTLGEIFGHLGRLGEEILSHMGPGIDNVLGSINLFIGNIVDGIISAMPVFNEFIQALFELLNMVLGPLSKAIGTVFEIFAGLPGPIQNTILTLGALFAAMMALSKIVPNVSARFTKFRDNVRVMGGQIDSTKRKVSGFFAGTTKEADKAAKSVRGVLVPTAGGGGRGTVFATMAKDSEKAARDTRRSADSIRTSILRATGTGSGSALAVRPNAGAVAVFGGVASSAEKAAKDAQKSADRIRSSTQSVASPRGAFVTNSRGVTVFGQISREAKQAEQDAKKSASRIRTSVSMVGAGESGAMPATNRFVTLGRGSVDSIKASQRAAQTNADAIAKAIRAQEPKVSKAGSGLGKAVTSGFRSAMTGVGAGLSILGGWPGLIIMGLIAAGTSIAGSIADQKAKIEAEAAALEEAVNNIQPTLGKAVSMDGIDFGPIASSDTFQAIRDSFERDADFKSIANKLDLDLGDLSVAVGSNLPQMQKYIGELGTIGADLAAAQDEFSTTTGSTWAEKMQTFEPGYQTGLALREQAGMVDKEAGDLANKLKEHYADMDKAGAGGVLMDTNAAFRSNIEAIVKDTSAFKDLTMNEVNEFIEGYERITNAVSDAKKNVSATNEEITASNKALSEFSIATSMAENWGNITSTLTSVEDKFASFQSNLALQGRDFMSGVMQAYDLAQLNQQIDTSFDGFRETLSGKFKDVNVKDLVKQVKDPVSLEDIVEFNFASDNTAIANASQEFLKTLQPIAEGIQTSFVQEYDRVLKASGNPQLALKTAQDVVAPLRESLEGELRALKLDEGVISSMMTTLGISEEQFAIGISLEAEAAIDQAIAVQNVLDGLASGDWRVILRGESEEVQKTITDTMDLAEGFSEQEFEAKLHVMADEANMTFNDFVKRLASAENPDAFVISIRDQGLDEVMGRIAELGTITSKEHTATVRTSIVETSDDIWATLDQLDGLDDKDFEAVVTAVLKGEDIDTVLAGIATKETKTGVSAELKNGEQTKADLEALGKDLEVDVKSTIVPPENLANGQLFAGIAAAGQGAVVKVTAEVEMGQVEHLRGVLSHYGTSTVNVSAVVSMGQVEHLRGVLSHYQNTSINISTSVSMGGVEHLRGVLSHYQNTNINVTTSVSMGGIEHLRGVLSAYKSTNIVVTTTANLSGVQAVQGAMAGIADKTITIHGNNSPANGAINHIRGALASLSDKTVTIHGQNNPANGAINHIRGALASLPNKTVTIYGNNSPANGAINHIRGALASLRDKTVTITTVNRTVNQGNNGMIMAGGVRTFANGGMDPRMAKALSRIKNKKENHTAQIAPGSNNYRIWGEAETGGEAYIPLSKAKRTRSMAILEQVASHFGVALSQYADGGYNMAGKSMGGGVTAFANGGTTTKTSAKEERQRVSDLRVTFNDASMNALKSFSGSMQDLFGATSSPVKDAISDLQVSLSDAIKGLEGTNSDQARRARKISSDINKQSKHSDMWSGGISQGLNFLSRNVVADGLTRRGRLAGITLRDLEDAQKHLNTRLEDARDILSDLNSEFDSARSGLRSSIEGEFDLGSLLGDTDEFGYRAPVTAKAISSYAKNFASRAKNFGQKMDLLRKAGYNPFLVDQIANMGLEDGLYVAEALLADKSQMKSINSSFSSVMGSWGQNSDGTFGLIGGIADGIGKASANAMYGASLNIYNGLVKGMESNLKNIETLGRNMGTSLLKGFNKALGIKSPSRKFYEATGYITDGILNRLDKDQSKIDSRFISFVSPSFDRNLGSTLSASTSDQRQLATTRQPVAQAPIHYEQNIYPTPGLSESQIGSSASNDFMFRLQAR